MSSISFDISGKIDRPAVDALSAVRTIADSLGIPFFVVGASARDYILRYCYGIEPRRMTTDIDLGVEVAGWEQYTKLRKALETTGKFIPDEREAQRLHFDSVFIDIVPFGPITDKDRRVAWPPEHEIFMSMVGFREAYEYSITVRFSKNPVLDVKVATLPGLAIMKLISWKEKYPERQKDAEDLLLIMHKYEETGNFDRLYEQERDLLKEESFDVTHASIRLLGRDMAKIADPETLIAIRTILAAEIGEQSQYRLANDMAKNSLVFDRRFDEVLLEVEKLKKGIDNARM
jgi:predicted nucleotidyltransferase